MSASELQVHRRGARGRCMGPCAGGFTLIEVLAAAVVATVIAWGTFMAFKSSAQTSMESVSRTAALAGAAESIERYRNKMACDDARFGANCAAANWSSSEPLPSNQFSTFVDPDSNATRTFTVTPIDDDGDLFPEKYRVDVTVNWTNPQ